MLRYGFSFEEIEWLSECVEAIDEREIVFNENINNLDKDKLAIIERYIYSDKY